MKTPTNDLTPIQPTPQAAARSPGGAGPITSAEAEMVAAAGGKAGGVVGSYRSVD